MTEINSKRKTNVKVNKKVALTVVEVRNNCFSVEFKLQFNEEEMTI